MWTPEQARAPPIHTELLRGFRARTWQGPSRAQRSEHGWPCAAAPQWGASPWLGNNEKTDDDAHGFYDRSLGDIEEKNGKPYQLGAADGPTGELTANYDWAGNLTSLEVERTGTCVPSGSSCAQTAFTYNWDEAGRLVRARRADGGPVVVDLRYRYDAGDQRVIKTAVAGTAARHTVYVFDTLELRRALWQTNNYIRSVATEVPYLFANGVRLARVVWEDSGEVPVVPVSGRDANVHVLFELGDHLGSTSVVLDQATGELVEKASFFAYGAAESDYRPERWDGFREDYRFTGKEEDVEVGLVYFGKRFLNPLLGRWVSPDPLGVHGPGAGDGNLYAYVRGRALQSIDPVGLQEADTRRTDDVAKIEASLRQAGVDPNAPTYVDKLESQVAQAVERKKWADSADSVERAKRNAEATAGQTQVAQDTAGPAEPPRNYGDELAAAAFTGIGTPLNVIAYAATGDTESFINAQKANIALTGMAAGPAAARAQQQLTDSTVRAHAPEAAPQGQAPGQRVLPINEKQQAGHVAGTREHALRISQKKPTSTFLKPSEVESLIQKAWLQGKPLGNQGNLRVYDFKRPVGIGPRGGGYQTQVRVSMNAKGEVHGTPYGPICQGPVQ